MRKLGVIFIIALMFGSTLVAAGFLDSVTGALSLPTWFKAKTIKPICTASLNSDGSYKMMINQCALVGGKRVTLKEVGSESVLVDIDGKPAMIALSYPRKAFNVRFKLLGVYVSPDRTDSEAKIFLELADSLDDCITSLSADLSNVEMYLGECAMVGDKKVTFVDMENANRVIVDVDGTSKIVYLAGNNVKASIFSGVSVELLYGNNAADKSLSTARFKLSEINSGVESGIEMPGGYSGFVGLGEVNVPDESTAKKLKEQNPNYKYSIEVASVLSENEYTIDNDRFKELSSFDDASQCIKVDNDKFCVRRITMDSTGNTNYMFIELNGVENKIDFNKIPALTLGSNIASWNGVGYDFSLVAGQGAFILKLTPKGNMPGSVTPSSKNSKCDVVFVGDSSVYGGFTGDKVCNQKGKTCQWIYYTFIRDFMESNDGSCNGPIQMKIQDHTFVSCSSVIPSSTYKCSMSYMPTLSMAEPMKGDVNTLEVAEQVLCC